MNPGEIDIKQLLIDVIENRVKSDPANRGEDGSPYFDAPLVGFASADDELFTRYKTIIGPFHWTPSEVLEQAYGPGALAAGTVICWVLPITEKTRQTNRIEGRYPSRRWARTRNYGELFNDVVRQSVVDFILEHGGRAAGPMLLDQWARVDDPDIGWASTWSERHAAYAAGLGTFSLNDGFITPLGMANRIGSVVTDLFLEPSEHPYSDYRENCLTCKGVECGMCVERCPVGAITLDGHDKYRCEKYTYGPLFKDLSKKFDAKHVGCGLCQTDVPCENTIPDSGFRIPD
ncbi:MAG: epoxyqueuosine reductase [bacterium]|nr:epoxyqueuosine reductase [bacterium]MDT8365394.1 epoxyqueuosine reductase [bacterium]